MDRTAPHPGGARYENGNVLIDALPETDRNRIIPHLTVFTAEVPDCFLLHGDSFDDVVFPIDGVFSTTAELGRGDVYEVAVTGRQGIIGAELALGVACTSRSVMVQVDGRSGRMQREEFLRCLSESSALTRAVHRHMLRRLFIAEQFVACNFAHDPTQRCARWMLMLCDEVGRDDFIFREEFLGMMLGLPASAAQHASRALSECGAIRYENEAFSLVDRAALREYACECYEAQRCFEPAAA